MAEESLFVKGRSALVTTLVAIALNPLSIALGYYLSRALAAPRLEIQYSRANVEVEQPRLSAELHKAVIGDSAMIALLDSAMPSCEEEFQENALNDRCIKMLTLAAEKAFATADFEATLVAKNIAAVEAWSPGKELVVTPMTLPGQGSEGLESQVERNKNAALRLLRNYLHQGTNRVRASSLALKAELARLSNNQKPARTGKVQLLVGVLNHGDADGVIVPNAKLRFGDTDLPLRSRSQPGYVVISGHSFEELVFEIDDKNSTEAGLKSWKSLIERFVQEKIWVTISTPTGNLVGEGRLPG
jgi:hypothetical protein